MSEAVVTFPVFEQERTRFTLIRLSDFDFEAIISVGNGYVSRFFNVPIKLARELQYFYSQKQDTFDAEINLGPDNRLVIHVNKMNIITFFFTIDGETHVLESYLDFKRLIDMINVFIPVNEEVFKAIVSRNVFRPLESNEYVFSFNNLNELKGLVNLISHTGNKLFTKFIDIDLNEGVNGSPASLDISILTHDLRPKVIRQYINIDGTGIVYFDSSFMSIFKDENKARLYIESKKIVPILEIATECETHVL